MALVMALLSFGEETRACYEDAVLPASRDPPRWHLDLRPPERGKIHLLPQPGLWCLCCTELTDTLPSAPGSHCCSLCPASPALPAPPRSASAQDP